MPELCLYVIWLPLQSVYEYISFWQTLSDLKKCEGKGTAELDVEFVEPELTEMPCGNSSPKGQLQ